MAGLPYIGKNNHACMCDICGMLRYSSQMRKNWKGELVCADTCWEPRDPQWEVPFRIPKEHRAVKDARPFKTVEMPSLTDWDLL